MKREIKLTISLFLCVLVLSSIVFSCASSEVEETESTASDSVAVEKTLTEDVPVIKKVVTVASQDTKSKLKAAILEGNDAQILSISNEILLTSPKDLMALNSLAVLHLKNGQSYSAIYLLNKALSEYPKNPELHNNLGLAFLTKGQTREAINSFRKALEFDSGNVIAASNIGALYLQSKDYVKAEIAFEVATKKGTTDFKILNNYAVALKNLGKTNESSEIYDKLLKENPTSKEVMLNYSILLIENQQKYKQGLDLLNRLKFVGPPPEARNIIKELENTAKAGLK